MIQTVRRRAHDATENHEALESCRFGSIRNFRICMFENRELISAIVVLLPVSEPDAVPMFRCRWGVDHNADTSVRPRQDLGPDRND